MTNLVINEVPNLKIKFALTCGPPTTPWWRLPSLAVPPAETETEGDEADEAGAAGGIVKVLCSRCRRRKFRLVYGERDVLSG